MNKFNYILAFLVGASVGAVAAWSVIKKKCDEVISEELDKLSEDMYEKALADAREELESEYELIEDDETEADYYHRKAAENYSKKDISEYASLSSRYTEYDEETEDEYDESSDNISEIRIIDPSSFGLIDDYNTITLYVYSDKVVVDEDLEVIDEPEEFVGYPDDWMDVFDDKDDTIYFINDNKETYYEVIYDPRTHEEAMEHYKNARGDD